MYIDCLVRVIRNTLNGLAARAAALIVALAIPLALILVLLVLLVLQCLVVVRVALAAQVVLYKLRGTIG